MIATNEGFKHCGHPIDEECSCPDRRPRRQVPEPGSPKRGRGGSQKGRVFQKVKRDPDNPLLKRTFTILTRDFEMLGSFAEGNASEGLRRLCSMVRLLDAARGRDDE
jgi:hypothetical protein